MSLTMRRLVYTLDVLLLVALFVGSVNARGSNFVVSPTDEAVEIVQLTPPDSVVGNMSVDNGFVDFFVTNPSYDIVFESRKTSFSNFSITANESGTYVMHFVNKYQAEDVNVSLSYGYNFSVVISADVHVSLFVTQTTIDGVTITRIQSNVHLDVSPRAFPVVGQSWKLMVYYRTNGSDTTSYYSPLPNATITVTVKVGDEMRVYNITTNPSGQAEFPFLVEYDDISFQAAFGGNESDIVALTQRTEHYVSVDLVGSMFTLSGVMSGITTVFAIAFNFKKKIRPVFNLLIGLVFCLSMLQLVTSVYSILFLWTPWGYPENIGFLNWTLMRYVSIVGVVIFVVVSILALWPKQRTSRVIVPLK